MFVPRSHVSIVLSVTLERLLNGGMKQNPNTSEVLNKYENKIFYTCKHLKDSPDCVIRWEQVTFLACDYCYSYRRMKSPTTCLEKVTHLESSCGFATLRGCKITKLFCEIYVQSNKSMGWPRKVRNIILHCRNRTDTNYSAGKIWQLRVLKNMHLSKNLVYHISHTEDIRTL